MFTRFCARLFGGLTPFFILAIVLTPPGLAAAARPTSDRLLPISTVAYLRIPDVKDLTGKFQETSIGRIVLEQQFKPLVAQLYESATQAFQPIEDRIELSLPELLALPQGELTLAIVEPEEGPPAAVMLMDVGGQENNARILIDHVGTQLEEAGAARSTETVEGTALTILDMQRGPRNKLVHALKKSTLLLTNHVEVAKALLGKWNGDQAQASLSDSDDFAAAISRTRPPRGAASHIEWFVDPIGFFKAVARDNVRAQAGLAVLPVLGLDGLRGVGGSITFATEQCDTLFHLHILLDDPRTGILAMVAFGEGDMTPEAWVPHDVANYRTGHLAVQKTYQELLTLYDGFRGEGALEAEIKRRVSDEIGIDFHKDVLEAIDGRLTHVTWFEPPARVGSEAWILGIRLAEAKSFRPILDKITARFESSLTQQTVGGIKYYQASQASPSGARGGKADDTGDAPPEGPSGPCFGIVGEYLLIADRPTFFKRAITTQADASKSLANELDFKLVASKLKRYGGTTQPCLVTFQRPEEGLRTLYDMATGVESRQRLAAAAENNSLFATLHQSLEDNPLPPFAVLRRYLAPGGGILTSDASGLHYTSFVLRRK